MLIVGSLALGGAPAATAALEDEAEDAAVELFLSTGGGTVIAPGGPMVSSVTIQNDAAAELSKGTATVELNSTPLANGAALDAWLDEGTAAGAFEQIASEPTPSVAEGSSETVTVVADAKKVDKLSPGVYPVRAQLSGARTDAQGWDLDATSVLVVSPDERETAVLVPLTATPESGALLSADELAALTAPDGNLTGQLDAITDSTAILAVDPAIPASIRMLGSSAPTSATDWLQRLEALSNDVFLLRFADADAAVQAHAKLPALLRAPDLTPLLRPEDFPATTPTPSTEPTDDETAAPSDEPELPGNDELLAIAGAHQGILWPRPEVTAKDLAAFDKYLDEDALTILSSDAVTGRSTAHSTAAGHDLLVADSAASARLSAAVELADRSAVDRELAAAAGHAFFAAGKKKSATVVVALDRSESRSPAALRDALSAFASSKVTLDRLKAQKPASVSLKKDPDTTRVPGLKSMLSGEKRLTSFASILTEPALLLAPERIRLLRATAVGADDGEYTTATAEHAKRVRTTLGAVGIQRPKPVQLFTSAAPLPVWIRNDLPWEINLQLIGSPSNRRLDMQQVTPVQALGSGVTRIDVPLEALVASGEVDVTFTLRSDSGVQIGQRAVANVTLRADWERIGLGILGGVIGLLLIFGIVRTVRRKKADAAERETENAPDAAEPAAEKATDAAKRASANEGTE